MVSFASWSVLTVDFLIILYLALGGVTLAALLHLVNAKWRFDVRFLTVSFFSLYPLAFVLLLILLWGGKTTFPWVGSNEPMPFWNNLTFLSIREILGMLVIGALGGTFIRYQAKSDSDPESKSMFRNVALLIPFAYVLYGTMVAWDFEMTLLPNWQSSIYAMYFFVSNFGMFLAFTVTLIYFLNKSGALSKPIGDYIYNYFAQIMLAFTILWVYTFFAQYLIIWYGNLPDETDRLFHMQYGYYGSLFWTFFAMKFVFPFVMLVFPFNRHCIYSILTVAASIMIGTWIERYTWISGTYSSQHTPMTSLFDIGVTAIVFGAAFTIVRMTMKKYKLIKA
ncbi:MAG: hypothetical protein ACYCY8_03170 [Burkholderiales bacterium]